MTKSKAQNKSKIKMTNTKTKKFCHLNFGFILDFVLCHLSLKSSTVKLIS